MTTHAPWAREAARLFRADCTRAKYAPKTETFVVSPANSRKVLDAFLKQAKTQLLIYDPKISDHEMLRVLQARTNAGVDIKVIGLVARGAPFDVRRLVGKRLHTRTIICDRRQAFIGSQSLRTAELDSRREVGLIVQDATVVKALIETFESDWSSTKAKAAVARQKKLKGPADKPAAVSARQSRKAVKVFARELDPLSVSIKKAVRKAVAKAGNEVLHDDDVRDTMKKVVKNAVKEAVKEAVRDAEDAEDVKEA